MDVAIERFITGPIENNTYVVHSIDKNALIVDPSSGCGEVFTFCSRNALSVKAILLTHGHFDHILGIPEVHKAFGAIPVWAHESDMPMITTPGFNGSNLIGTAFAYRGPVSFLTEGPAEIGGFSLDVLHVPGHSPGGVAFLFGSDCLSGDTLFAGSIGRADFPGGEYDLLISSIQTKLMNLPAETVVHPGHGGRTTIGRELRTNPFLR